MWEIWTVWVSAKRHNNGVRVGEDELEEKLKTGWEPYAVDVSQFGITHFLKKFKYPTSAEEEAQAGKLPEHPSN